MGDIPSDREGYGRAINMAWPSIIESVLLALVTLIDTLMVSGLGEEAVAAVGITSQPRLIVLALIFSLNIGVTAVVARRKGQQDQEGANSCLKQCMLICGVISVALAVICSIFSEPLLRFAGAQEDYIEDACTYFRILMLGIFFNAMSLTINAAQRGAGNTKISMRSNLTANLVNIVFNYFLINAPLVLPQVGRGRGGDGDQHRLCDSLLYVSGIRMPQAGRRLLKRVFQGQLETGYGNAAFGL